MNLIVYFTFGYDVAWRTPGLPASYGGPDPGTFLGQLTNVARATPWWYGVTFRRGLIWTGAGCLIIRVHSERPGIYGPDERLAALAQSLLPTRGFARAYH